MTLFLSLVPEESCTLGSSLIRLVWRCEVLECAWQVTSAYSSSHSGDEGITLADSGRELDCTQR